MLPNTGHKTSSYMYISFLATLEGMTVVHSKLEQHTAS